MAGAGGGTRYGPFTMRAACALLGSLAAAAAKGTPKPGTPKPGTPKPGTPKPGGLWA